MIQENAYKRFLSVRYDSGKRRKLPSNIACGVDFSSNDYLGLAKERYDLSGLEVGSTGSRLLSGNHPVFTELEREIAACKGAEAALYFATGYQTNLSCLAALMCKNVLGQKAITFFDKLNHASLYDAARLAGIQLLRFPHLRYDKLEDSLKQCATESAPKFIVSETVFGMDGDFADIERLIYLAKKYDAFLYLDEAHSTGLYGRNGYGLSTLYDFAGVNCLIMGTMSKAVGASGGYVAGSQILIDYLVNACRGFIYSTAPSPITAYIALQNWRKLAGMDQVRSHLQSLSTSFANAMGISTNTLSNIFPIIIGDNQKARDVHDALLSKGIQLSCILPPTVPTGTARLRAALNASHKAEDIDLLASLLKNT